MYDDSRFDRYLTRMFGRLYIFFVWGPTDPKAVCVQVSNNFKFNHLFQVNSRAQQDEVMMFKTLFFPLPERQYLLTGRGEKKKQTKKTTE